MARLKFVPRAGMAVPYPGRGPGDNHHAGRSIVVDELTKAISNPATEDPVEAVEGSEEAARFIQFVVRDGDMHPFDEATAKACGVPFVKLTRVDGEWVPEKSAAKPAERKAS